MTCPICRDTGIAHSAPYIVGLRDGDREHTFTLCTCPIGRAMTEDIAAQMAAQQARKGEEAE